MGTVLEHLAHGEGRETLGGVGDALHLQAQIGQGEDDLLQRRVGVEVLLEPGKRELHVRGP
jgi:hypothetical protein